MGLVQNHQCRPPKLARQVDERLEKELYELAALRQLKLVEIDYRRNLVLDKPAREQRGLARISRQLAASAHQQHVHGLAQACKFALIVQDDGLNARAFGDEPEQPRLATARVSLNEKSRVDQRGEVKLQLLTTDDLADNHRRFLVDLRVTAPAGAASWRRLSKKSEIVMSLPALSWG